MKFKAKPREVTVGILKPSAHMHYAAGPGAPTQIAVIDLATRRAEVMPLEDFIDQFEPADEDAEMMFEGLKSRPKPPNPFAPPPEPEDLGYDIEDQEGNRLRMRPIRPRKKKDDDR